MLAHIFENFLLGFAISAVPGAVFFETLRRSILAKTSVTRFLAGNFSGMAIIVTATYLGIDHLLSSGVASTIFYLVSGSLLIYLGVTAIRVDKHKMKRLQADVRSSKKSAYLTGLTLAIANPISILFWTSQMGKFLEKNSGGAGALFDSVTILLGALILFVVLVVISRLIKSKLTIDRLLVMSRLFGTIIAAYGLVTLVSALRPIV